MQKHGLGANPLDNIIPDVSKVPDKVKPLKSLKAKTLKVQKAMNSETTELLVSLRPDQREFLDRLSGKIMRGRTSEFRQQRITKNAILRAAIDIIEQAEDKLNITNIPNEAVLAERIQHLLAH